MKLYRDFESQEELDNQYILSNTVPDSGIYGTHYVTRSAAARRDLDCRLDLSYGPTLAEHLDLFPTEPGAPVLVFIHGGYWRNLSSKEFSLVATGPVSRGVLVAVTNYELCPRVTIDEITRQNRAAIAWLYNNVERYGGDPERIFVTGHSAGGHQTAMMLSTDWEGDYGLPADVIKGGIAISGVFDLRPLPYTYLQPKLQLTHETILRQSPLLNIPKAAPPLHITLGENEPAEFHRQARTYFEAWTAVGLPGELSVQAGKNHFDVIDGFEHIDNAFGQAIQKLVGH